MSIEVGGYVEPGFEGVRDAFARNFDEHGEAGAATRSTSRAEGRRHVGWRAPDTGDAYDDDTLQIVFSSTKGATATCPRTCSRSAECSTSTRRSSRTGPSSAQAGKEHIPVRWLLSHQAGLPTVDAKLPRDEAFAWEPVIHALEVQTPYWEPGTAHGYHALTYGYLVGEVVRRIDGRSLGTFFHDEIAEPLGLEFWIGLPEEYEHAWRR